MDKQYFPSNWYFGHIVRSFVNPTANSSDELPEICCSKPRKDSKRESFGLKIHLKIFPSTRRMLCWHPRRKNFDQQLNTFHSSPKSIEKEFFWEQKSSQSNLWTRRKPIWQPCLKIWQRCQKNYGSTSKKGSKLSRKFPSSKSFFEHVACSFDIHAENFLTNAGIFIAS